MGKNPYEGGIDQADVDVLICRLREENTALTNEAADFVSVARAFVPPYGEFGFGDRVTKISGGSWTGPVCGWYRTTLTPIGYAVESENEPGSVQIYPEKALRRVE